MTRLANQNINRAAQSFEPGERVELFTIDTTVMGFAEVFAITPSSPGQTITFRGVTYTAWDLQSEGWEYNGSGSIPQPKLRISNADGLFTQRLLAYKDLVGAQVTRIITYSKFLDGAPQADTEAMFDPEVYTIEQKISANKTHIEWLLSSVLDQEGRMLPSRKVLRDVCVWRYRVWNAQTGSYSYANVQCPYTGSGAWDKFGVATTPNKDQCGRKLSDCKLRFGNDAVLPYGGFPGVSRVRV